MSNFSNEVLERIEKISNNQEINNSSNAFMRASTKPKYCYNFSWLGRPIIQYPQDIVAMQEIIWKVKPDLIIETGIAHGGSLIFSSSMLALLDMEEAIRDNKLLDLEKSSRKVLGIDVDIRKHNKASIEEHSMSRYIQMIEGSSIEPDIVKQVKEIAKDYQRILVCLDSNHTHEHVLAELEAYASLTSKDSYCIVFDTIIEDLPDDMYPDRSWGPGNNPKTAVWDYLKKHPEFKIDKNIQNKLLITVAPDGYLKRLD